MLQRDVGVTVLRRLAARTARPATSRIPTGATRAGEMVVRALRSGSFEHNGCARLLDVLAPEGSRIPPTCSAPRSPSGWPGAAWPSWWPTA